MEGTVKVPGKQYQTVAMTDRQI